ncbi:MAG: flavodoxin [Puniceicoccaceae bacterium]|nr:MAG: flavodoxin [Puniceicoccaceae bacterium]
MRPLIVFQTRHGATEKVAHFLATFLEGAVLHRLGNGEEPEILDYNPVVVGGSIHAGRIQTSVRSFCTRRHEALLTRRLGLYICCMREGEVAEQELKESFEEALREHAVAIGTMGGEFDFDKMNFLERFMVRKLAGVSEPISRLDLPAAERFARRLLG